MAVSSGSMANLLALSAVAERYRLEPGDRVVVAGATFVSAVTPVVQLGLTPVFVDVEEGGVNTDLNLVEDAMTRYRPKAALLPHTLGQALDVDRLAGLRSRYGLGLIEDCCESLGARSGGMTVGSAGDVATFSFYAGHHLTMGEGGVAACNDTPLSLLLRSLRSFGRDTAYGGHRFCYPVNDRQIAPEERYIHVRIGWNAKLTDLQAAFGRVQLNRHAALAGERRRTAGSIVDVIRAAPGGWRVLGRPDDSEASPFGVPFLVPPGRCLADIARVLVSHGIEPRGLLGTSQHDQPCFDSFTHVVHQPYTRAPEYAKRGLIVGCPPGIDPAAASGALQAAVEALK